MTTFKKQASYWMNLSFYVPRCALLLSLLTFSISAWSDVVIPGNSRIIESASADAISLAIIRYVDLEAGSVVGNDFSPSQYPDIPAQSASEWLIRSAYEQGAAVTALIIRSIDYSDGIAEGEMDSITVIAAESDLGGLGEELLGRSSVEQIENTERLLLFRERGSSTDQSGAFDYFGILEDNIVVLAQSEQLVRNFAQEFLATQRNPSTRWADLLANIPAEAPILLLRDAEVPNLSAAAQIPVREVDEFLAAMWIVDQSRPMFNIKLLSNFNTEDTLEHFRTVTLLDSVVDPEEFELNLFGNPGGYFGTLEFENLDPYPEPGTYYLDLIFLWMQGILFVI